MIVMVSHSQHNGHEVFHNNNFLTKQRDIYIFTITAELISHSVWSKAMVNKSTDHGNDVMVV